MKVQCPGCKKVFWETTDRYDPNIRAHGGMVRLLNPWKGWGWAAFDNEGQAVSSTLASEMICPNCQAQIAPSGRLTVLPAETSPELPSKWEFPATVSEPTPDSLACPVCGKVCKSKAGLLAHIRSHK